jgi:hypothetical protein
MKNADKIKYDPVLSFSQLFALWDLIPHILVPLRWLMDAAVQNEFVSSAHGLVGNNMSRMLMGERASLKWKVGSNDVIKELDFVVLKRMNFRRKNSSNIKITFT